MDTPSSPPPVAPKPPNEELEEEPRRDRRLQIWLIAVSVVAVLAAAAAGYAISEIESTKDENREDDQAVSALRADQDVLREQLSERLDAVEGRLDNAADRAGQRKLEDDLKALDKRVERLANEDDGGDAEEVAQRVDDLEQRVEDLEEESN